MSRSRKTKIEKHGEQPKLDSSADGFQATLDGKGLVDRQKHSAPSIKPIFAMFGTEPSDEAMAALMMTAKITHRFCELKISQNAKFSKLSGPRMGVLVIVHQSGTIRMGDLASKLNVAPRTVTDLVDGMERDGFLHRVPDSKDRRAALLELSATAKKDFDRITEFRSSLVREIFSPLSNAEKETIVLLLSKLRDGPISKVLSEDLANQD